MQNRESQNIMAALDLHPDQVEAMAKNAATMHRLTFAQLVAMASRLERSRAKAKAARAASNGMMIESLDQIDAHLSCIWALVEAELERRVPNR
ncbi:MAG: hypothetical protein LAT78_13130, partial [Roseinatronobacter sp.]|nr:hypothetical protein [Roseinatronobacter sp.]